MEASLLMSYILIPRIFRIAAMCMAGESSLNEESVVAVQKLSQSSLQCLFREQSYIKQLGEAKWSSTLPTDIQIAWNAASNIAAPGRMARSETLCSHSQASLATARLQ